MMEWWEKVEAGRRRKGWSVSEYHRQIHADGGPPISLSLLRKWLKGVVAQPRGGDIPLSRLAAPLDLDVVELRYDLSNVSTGAATIPLLTLNEIGTIDPSTSNFVWEGTSVEVLSSDVGSNWFGVEVPDNACAPKILKGSIVYCNPDAEPGPDDFVVARIEKDGKWIGACRRFEQPDGHDPLSFRLVPERESYPRYTSTPENPIKVWLIEKILTDAKSVKD